VSLTCNQLRVEIRPVNNAQSACYNCNQMGADCHRVQFEVFLVANNLPSHAPFFLCYTDLSITVKLSGSNPGGLPMLSTLNKDASIYCSTGYGFESLMDVDDAEKIVAMTTAGSTLHPPLYFDQSNAGCLGFLNPGVKLFTIVLDAWPGETVSAECGELVYTRPESGSPDYNGNGLLECDEDGTGDENPDPVVTTLLSCQGAQAVLSPTGLPHPDLTVNVNAVDLGNLPDYALIPVTVSSALSGFTYLDFAVRLTVDQLMTAPEVLPGDYAQSPGFPKLIPVPNAANPDIDDYILHARFENVTFVPNSDILFTVKVNAPVYMSEGGKVCPSVLDGRLQTASACGSAQFSESGECAAFGGKPVCDEDYAIRVSGVPVQGIQSDCKLQVLVGFNWAPTAETFAFHTLNLRFDFDAPDEVSLESIDPNGAIVCPGTNNPATCPAGCYSGNGTRTVTVCFRQGAQGQYLILDKEAPYMILTFDAPSNCISGVTLRQAELGRVELDANGNWVQDLPVCRLETPDPDGPLTSFIVEGFPLCVPFLKSEVNNSKPDPEPVQDVDVLVESADPPGACAYHELTGCEGYSACVCSYGYYDVTPTKDGNDLNGVSTFDLVLISKHILGLEPLPSPYLMIAADANKSNSVTTVDIVEIRKLILGLINEFTLVNSWRFVPKNFVFSDPGDPNNPFYPLGSPDPFPEEALNVPVQPNTLTSADFVAVKMGDVNNSHIANTGCRPAAKTAGKSAFPLGLSAPPAKSGEHLSVALSNAGREPLAALQAGLRFRPEDLEFVGASLGQVGGLSPDCFGLAKKDEGEIRMVWLSPDFEAQLWEPGQALCHFVFRAKRDLGEGAAAISLDEAVLEGEAVTSDSRAFALAASGAPAMQRAENQGPEPLLRARCLPNPVTGAARMVIEAPRAGKARLMLFSAFGARAGYREFELAKGVNEVALPEAAAWPPGVYSWLLMLGSQRAAEGRVVKQ
jgi:hypothetical protein